MYPLDNADRNSVDNAECLYLIAKLYEKYLEKLGTDENIFKNEMENLKTSIYNSDYDINKFFYIVYMEPTIQSKLQYLVDIGYIKSVKDFYLAIQNVVADQNKSQIFDLPSDKGELLKKKYEEKIGEFMFVFNLLYNFDSEYKNNEKYNNNGIPKENFKSLVKKQYQSVEKDLGVIRDSYFTRLVTYNLNLIENIRAIESNTKVNCRFEPVK